MAGAKKNDENGIIMDYFIPNFIQIKNSNKIYYDQSII
jgi:hypothetical protein